MGFVALALLWDLGGQHRRPDLIPGTVDGTPSWPGRWEHEAADDRRASGGKGTQGDRLAAKFGERFNVPDSLRK